LPPTRTLEQMSIPTLTTRRLILRPFTTGDARALHAILSVEGVLRFFPKTEPPSPDAVERLIAAQRLQWAERGLGRWAVELRDGGELIGWNGLDPVGETAETEIGFLLNRPFWGRGLAVEGAREVLRFGFETRGLERVVALAHPENAASQRVVEKLGMTFANRAEYFGMEMCRYVLGAEDYALRVAPPRTYWVVPGRLLAGVYPADPGEPDPGAFLRELLRSGIETFIDLTQEGENGTVPYLALLAEEARRLKVTPSYFNSPVPDFGVPGQREMRTILDQIHAALAAGSRTYLHCFAGRGRTAAVAGCYLIETGLTADAALAVLRQNRSGTDHDGEPYPAAKKQQEIVRRWEKRRTLR
jgi:RimJ/RimL family protein N-acetyltransferase/protein-tyrosine phosphatase